jgi:glycosyl transferase family 61
MRAPRLALLSFRGVVVTPYTDLLGRPLGQKVHRGGPRWPDWPSQTAARHCRRGTPVDDEPPEGEPSTTLPGPLAWGGAITTHFGHQIADFSTRLLPTLAEMPDARFAFSMHRNLSDRFSSWENTPDYFRQVLEWYGISRDRVELIAEPTLVERLLVAPQAEQQPEPGPEPWYLDLLDAHTRSRFGEVRKSGLLYASRAGTAARFAGEAYLERALVQAGFRALRPETVPVEEKLRQFVEADRLVIPSGSAIHIGQLMGRVLGDVMVVTRRAGGHLGRALLEPRARSLRYVDAVRGVVLGLNEIGNLNRGRGLSILDPEALQAALPIGDIWDTDEFEAAVEADARQWLETERESGRWNVPGSADLIREGLEEVRLGHLG